MPGVRVTVSSPAKINLYLAITGRRADGFHDLVSVATPLAFGDTLEVETGEGEPDGGPAFRLECDDPALPADGTNLVLKAATAFAQATGWGGRAVFRLTKRIPVGAGLGGGSSNATTALRALNALAGHPLGPADLAALVARIGSDCALFLADGPVVMRGRGERVEPFAAAGRLAGRRVLLFKPGFGIATAWAYGRLAAAPAAYLPEPAAEARLAAWLADPRAPLEDLLFNSFEPPVFEKFPALPVLLDRLRAEFGLAAHLSGSGSACFALPGPDTPVAAVVARIREAWGPEAFVTETRLAG